MQPAGGLKKMASFNESMQEYKQQLERGLIQQAYRGLMDYMQGLKTYFRNHYPYAFVSGGLYQGYMDMTYFSFVPASLKSRDLKIAIVFVYDAFRFEAWLSGCNRQVQARYWEIIRESTWDQYPLVPDPLKADAILTHVLVADPDFGSPDALTAQIEQGTLAFTHDIETFLSTIQD
jgi:hypothetical protein